VRFIRGNADRAVLGGDDPSVPPEVMAQVRWCTGRMGDRLREVARWPLTTTLDVDGLGDVLFCHATPRADDELVTPATPDDEVAAVLSATPESTVVCGHIHVQYDRLVAGTRLVGAGSVGRPNERPAGAYWLLLGGPSPVEHLRIDYDVERTVADAAAAGYPSEELGQALREPPDREETIATFESWRGA
jgi:predicted phosphodiesterase